MTRVKDHNKIYLQRAEQYAYENGDLKCKPDIIVTDLVMPEVTGLELCRTLKRMPETADIPIIACTTKGRKIDQTWAKKQGIAAYIVKPCTEEQLVNAVHSFER